MSDEKPRSQGLRPGQKSRSFWPSAKRIVAEMRPERVLVILAIVIVAVATVLQAFGPKVLGRGTDIIFEGVISRQLPAGTTAEQAEQGLRAAGQDQLADMVSGMGDIRPGEGIDFTALVHVLLGVIALYVVASLLLWLQAYLVNKVIFRLIYRMRRDIELKLHKLPLAYFDRTPRGEIMSRVTNDIDNLQQTLNNTLGGLLASIFTVITVIVMMFSVSWELTLIALLVIPLAAVVTGIVGTRSQKKFQQQWDATGVVNAEVEEAFSGHELIKVFGRTKQTRARFAERNEEMYEASFGAQFLSSLMQPLMMFISNLAFVAVAVIGGLRVANGQLTLGSVQAFIQYSRQFTQPLSQVASMATMLQSGVASAERIFEILDAEEEIPDRASVRSDEQGVRDPYASIQQGRVEFEHVKFSYSPDKPLIEDLSLVAEPGHTVAIVGPTGAGKTTLVNLIMRFYELDGGAITIDGVDTRDLTRRQLRARTGMVLQDTWLFAGTIRENIRYGRLDATDEEVVAAAKATYVDEFVSHLPAGYDTELDAEGSNVSAGQKQLLTIARAFLADPALLILDEATSSVDTRTEKLVQTAMNTLRSGRTSFVIAHRLSTIRDADLILMMENGSIVEQGTHDELLEADGAYAALYNSQFEGGVDIDAEEAATTTGAMQLGLQDE